MNSVIAKFRFLESWDIFESYASLVPEREVRSFDDGEALRTFVAGKSACLIVCSIKDKEDLIALASLMKSLRSEKGFLTKVLAANFTGSKEVESIIAKMDVPDVLNSKMPGKAFRLRMDMWLKALDGEIRKRGAEEATYEIPSQSDRPSIGSSISFGGVSATCVLDDVQDKTVYVKVVDEIPIGGMVDLSLTLEHKKRKIPVSAGGRVAAVIPDEDGGFYVEVQIHEKDVPQVSNLVSALQARQEEITQFLKAATGKY